MKHLKELFSILYLLASMGTFTACSDDNDEETTDEETLLS